MKNITLFLIFFISYSLNALDVSVTHATFNNNKETYVEYYFHYVGKTLNFLPVNEKITNVQAAVEVLILIKKQGAIIDYDKYKLSSPVFTTPSDFQDIKRFVLPKGDYVIEIEIVDLNNLESTFKWNGKKNISGFQNQIVDVSDVQLLASVVQSDETAPTAFSKSGFTFEILPYDFLHEKYKQINFYSEFYNLDKNEDQLYVSYGVRKDFVGKKGDEVYIRSKKIKNSEQIVPYLSALDIKELKSGNYHVFVEIKNRNKEILAAAYRDFQRSNPGYDFEISLNSNGDFEDSFVKKLDQSKLDYYVRAHMPIARADMISVMNSVLKDGSAASKKYFLYKHWTDVNEAHAGTLFDKYMEVADALDKMYNSGFGYGFETDRGYIYLRYGRPSQQIEVTDEPSAPPYEIWAYDVIPDTGETNVKFVFYNPTLQHNAFDLLHSTCRGERFNPAWETELYKNATTEDTRRSIDATTVQDNMGRNARRLFDEL